MTDDLAARLKASNEAQMAAKDILAAGEAILKAGNALHADINSVEAFGDTLKAISAVNVAFAAYIDVMQIKAKASDNG